eukprot:CAMPEP_0117652818 /NCGR_PEP_ID=MMETSP0804-20121206/2840_1 /TAXON_ID=1074897 /ORGANISM="Tetraselmis astigmatica, Strain CCMP880" /LENGTH=99 /DNA_ID=CAMNT_0005458911 /DNA_START=146 /DNA_END=445 /DNA_ORIENTATION=-
MATAELPTSSSLGTDSTQQLGHAHVLAHIAGRESIAVLLAQNPRHLCQELRDMHHPLAHGEMDGVGTVGTILCPSQAPNFSWGRGPLKQLQTSLFVALL